MRKLLCLFVLLILLSFSALSSFAKGIVTFPYNSVHYISTIDSNNPFSMNITYNTPLHVNDTVSITLIGKANFRADLTMRVYIDEFAYWLNYKECGIRDTVIDGDTAYTPIADFKGNYDGHQTTSCKANLVFMFPDTGQYLFEYSIFGRNLDDTTIASSGYPDETNFFVHNDTVVTDYDLYTRERMTMDSIDFVRNYPDRRFNLDSMFLYRRLATGAPPFMVSEDLDRIVYTLGWLNYPDLPPKNNVPPRFDSIDIRKPKTPFTAHDWSTWSYEEHLLYKMPNLENLKYNVTLDNSENKINGQLVYEEYRLQRVVWNLEQQITELYYFDQFILHSDLWRMKERLKLRKNFLAEQTKERHERYLMDRQFTEWFLEQNAEQHK